MRRRLSPLSVILTNIVYKIPERIQNTISEHCIYIKDQKNKTNRRNRQRILINM